MVTQLDQIGKGIAIVIAIAGIAMLLAFIIPAIQTGQDQLRTETFGQTESDTVFITSSLAGTLNSVSSSGTAINVTVFDFQGDDSQTISGLSEGQTQSITIANQTINVTNVEKLSNQGAIIAYQYPVDFAWGSITVALYAIIVMLLLIMVLIYIIGGGFSIMEGS